MSGQESGQGCFLAVLEIFGVGVNQKNGNLAPRRAWGRKKTPFELRDSASGEVVRPVDALLESAPLAFEVGWLFASRAFAAILPACSPG